MRTTKTGNGVGRLVSAACIGGPLAGLAVTNGYDGFLRRQTVTVSNASPTILHRAACTHDGTGRLETVPDDTGGPARIPPDRPA